MKDIGVSEPICECCGEYAIWEECDDCFGMGYVDASSEDPVAFSPGEQTYTCLTCGGSGGYYVCPHQYDTT